MDKFVNKKVIKILKIFVISFFMLIDLYFYTYLTLYVFFSRNSFFRTIYPTEPGTLLAKLMYVVLFVHVYISSNYDGWKNNVLYDHFQILRKKSIQIFCKSYVLLMILLTIAFSNISEAKALIQNNQLAAIIWIVLCICGVPMLWAWKKDPVKAISKLDVHIDNFVKKIRSKKSIQS